MQVGNPPPLAPLPSGNDPAVLPYLPRWNWGAALAQYVWAFAHGLYGVGTLVLLVHLCGLGLFSMYWLGSVGNDLAWRHCHFKSYDEFLRKQRAWVHIGVWITIIQVVLLAIALVFAVTAVNRLLSATGGDLGGQNNVPVY